MTSPRIAFLDVDGTIVDSGELIAPSTIEAVRTARSNGHLVYISTGRGDSEIPDIIRDIGFDGVISAGGGFATIGGELVVSRAMPEKDAARMIFTYENLGYDFYLQSFDEVFPSPGVYGQFVDYLRRDILESEAAVPDGTRVIEADEHPALVAFANVRPFDLTGIAKSVFIANDENAFERVVDALGDDFHIITGTIPHMGNGSGEVALKGVNKGSAILEVLAILGIDAASAIGIGDSSNDIEMLQVCGVGIAMGNATDAIKAHADEVTTAVLDDGVWNAFQRHGLV